MEKALNKHAWDGACSPSGFPQFETFSVGIFKWVQGRNGLKRSKVVYRVRGYSSRPSLVYRRASDICSLMDAGKWKSYKKSEFVK